MPVQNSLLSQIKAYPRFSMILLNLPAYCMFMMVFHTNYQYPIVLHLKIYPFSTLGSLPPMYIPSLSFPLFYYFFTSNHFIDSKGYFFLNFSVFKFLFTLTILSERIRFIKPWCNVFSQYSLKGVSRSPHIPKVQLHFMYHTI